VKKVIIIILSYSLVFVVGYLTVGIILHFAKPEVKMLPAFIENALPEVEKEDQLSLQQQSLEGMDYSLLTPTDFDTTVPIYFNEHYNEENGIFCFRGNAQRNRPTRGTISGKPTTIELDWVFETAYDSRMTDFGVWGGGSGWTGQPLVIRWPEEQRNRLFELDPAYLNQEHFKEVIVGSLSGNIYFLDFETGKATRPHLSIGNPIKGTVSVDPRMNGLMTVGQGIPNGDRFGAYLFDLFAGKEMDYRAGMDPTSRRLWGAHDSNPLFDAETGALFWPAENGQIYKTIISSDRTFGATQKFNYGVQQHPDLGLEASMGAFKNLGFFGDNGGNVFCLNLTTMRPVWLFDNIDDTDASLVIETEGKTPFLYLGNEVDKQGPTGTAYIRKLNALTGKEQWHFSRPCSGSNVGGKANSGGVLATVLPGKEKAKGLVFGIFSRPNGTMKGEFVAIDKETGKERYTIPMDAYSWASPIDLYDKKGNCYIFFTDVYGTIYLIDGVTGAIIHKEKTSYVFESSPVAWGNRIVVGTRGKTILSFLVK
jgi:outer membrane protein assembly factor BamB